MALLKLAATLFLPATVLAQQHTPEPGLHLTFYDASTTPNCSDNIPSTGITFRTQNVPLDHTCFSLDVVFGKPNVTNTQDLYPNLAPCDREPCGLDYTLEGTTHYDPSTNYSSLYYLHAKPARNSPDFANIEVQTYGGEGCLQGGLDDSESLFPWVQWNCYSEGDCTVVPYRIRSFALTPTDGLQDARGSQCVIGKENGGSGVFQQQQQSGGFTNAPFGTAWYLGLGSSLIWLIVLS
ncbi:hypothetical protein B0A50_01555 [Salinomyces thailandicus]|uniref:Uncharacterized protein n=1 Tax=Salinomyces thailandicus TaxID=706561 RepID=A0A4U0UBA0_9PEZI|nr:hypothetical protein B0A50_01555 [Salinomyces thailandica]